MAIISSYPILPPQLGDSVLGSNIVDSTGAPVLGNPTVQYSMSSVKTLVDQQYIQQFSQGSTAVTQGPAATNVAYIIKFGAANATDNVSIATTGVVTFLTTGTYKVDLVYYIGNIPDANIVVTLFRTLQNTTQLGATTLEQFKSNSNTARKRVAITYTVNVTGLNTTHTQEMYRDANGSNEGLLVQTNINNTISPIASAQITISKLI
jgi:hypothetical protein